MMLKEIIILKKKNIQKSEKIYVENSENRQINDNLCKTFSQGMEDVCKGVRRNMTTA